MVCAAREVKAICKLLFNNITASILVLPAAVDTYNLHLAANVCLELPWKLAKLINYEMYLGLEKLFSVRGNFSFQ